MKRERNLRILIMNRAWFDSQLFFQAYVQQLESGRLKLVQLEQELERARRQVNFHFPIPIHGWIWCVDSWLVELQGAYGGLLNTGNSLLSGNVMNAGIATFEMEYELWIGEQRKKDDDLRKVLLTHTSDVELRMFVDTGLNHYYDLFRMKADAAKADVFYLLNGLWRTPVERFFQWIGGFRPSELLYVSFRLQLSISIKQITF